jgi:hypothetical protein
MAGQARAVVKHAEQYRGGPLTARRQHRARADVAVPVEESADILRLVAAHFTLSQARLGALGARGLASAQAPSLAPSLALEEAADARVGGYGCKR